MKLADIFTNHMVLQANKPIKIFGEGTGSISIEFLGESFSFEAQNDNWCVSLKAYPYGGPYEMKIILNNEKIVLNDIYVGEVWLFSGQSNMEMPLFRTAYGIEEAEHSKNDKIRFFTVPHRVEKEKQLYGWYFQKSDGKDRPWQLCCENSALHFTAIGYYTAKRLHEKLGCAIGAIECDWGGMPIESFIKREYFYENDCLKNQIEKYNTLKAALDMQEYLESYENICEERKQGYFAFDCDEAGLAKKIGIRAAAAHGTPQGFTNLPDGIYEPSKPGVIFDAMLSRIAPCSLSGVVWYQGETNEGYDYAEKYKVFMQCMRNEFECPDLPFYAVELASFNYFWRDDTQKLDDRFIEKTDSIEPNIAFTREQQQLAVQTENNNYLVTSMGLGDINDIHPIFKAELSRRIVLKILRYSYGFEILADQPLVESAEFTDNAVVLTFRNADCLYTDALDNVKMYIADSSKKLKRAKITIEENRLILKSDEVKAPKYVRYGFEYYYSGSCIYNSAGLPIPPFRQSKF